MSVADALPRTAPRSGRRWWQVLTVVTLAELREDRDLTVIGFVKWAAEPIMYLFTYVILVQVMFNSGGEKYPLFVFCAVLPWQFFQNVVPGALMLLPVWSTVLQNRSFPRNVLPISMALKEATTLVLSLALFLPLMVIYDVSPTVHLLWLPLLVAILFLLSLGPAYLCAVLGLYFPDFRRVVASVIRLGFLASTALIRADDIPGNTVPKVIKANPMSGVFNSFRRAIFYGVRPKVFDLIYPTAAGLVLLAVGLLVYQWREAQFGKEL